MVIQFQNSTPQLASEEFVNPIAQKHGNSSKCQTYEPQIRCKMCSVFCSTILDLSCTFLKIGKRERVSDGGRMVLRINLRTCLFISVCFFFFDFVLLVNKRTSKTSKNSKHWLIVLLSEEMRVMRARQLDKMCL